LAPQVDPRFPFPSFLFFPRIHGRSADRVFFQPIPLDQAFPAALTLCKASRPPPFGFCLGGFSPSPSVKVVILPFGRRNFESFGLDKDRSLILLSSEQIYRCVPPRTSTHPLFPDPPRSLEGPKLWTIPFSRKRGPVPSPSLLFAGAFVGPALSTIRLRPFYFGP